MGLEGRRGDLNFFIPNSVGISCGRLGYYESRRAGSMSRGVARRTTSDWGLAHP